MSYSRNNSRRQAWITAYRVGALVLLLIVAVSSGIQLFRPAPEIPTATEIAEAVNGSSEFQRPSAMEYVVKTDSCVVGGTVASTQWHVGSKVVDIGDVDADSVDYTSFQFMSDEGRQFNVSANGALFTTPGSNLGLELHCDPATMQSDKSFGMLAIIYGGA